MSQKAIRWIISLMSASLICLIAFQAYWLSLTLKEKEAEFDKTIAEVLATVDNKLQKLEASSFIKSFDIKRDSDFQFTSKGNAEDERIIIRKTVRDSASVIKEIKKKVEDIPLNANAIVITSKTTSSVHTSADSLQTNAQVLELYQNKKNKLTEIVDELSFKFAFDIKSLKERIEGIDIGEVIDEVLSDYGLSSLDYSIQLKDVELDSIIYEDSLSNSGNTTNYERLVFEEAGIQSGGILRMKIPNKTTYLFHSLWLPIIISLLLTAILIYTFSYTVLAIFKQKKIAKIKADFINNMTHEFKTPVATISLAIDSMLHQDVRKDDEELNRYGHIIKRENQRMNNQIERLLEMALFDREEIQLDSEKINAHQLIHEVSSDFKLKIDENKGTLNLELNAKQDTIQVDRMHFYNVLRNLIDNAIKYSKNSFQISIQTFNEEKNLIIQIQDNGIGMDQATMDRVFDRFYRKTSGNIHQTKGFGLGLAYSKEILEKMQASISVQSKPHKGSEFTLKVPLSNG